MSCKFCYNCQKEETSVKFKYCSVCRMTCYCSIECQKNDWSDHSELCSSMKAIREITNDKQKQRENRCLLNWFMDFHCELNFISNVILTDKSKTEFTVCYQLSQKANKVSTPLFVGK